jgi:hypothetical protein
MKKTAEQIAAEEAAKKKADDEAAAKKAVDDAAAAAAAADEDDADEEAKKKKKEKTFTKAEIEAAAKKAVEDAKKKWEEEKDLTELERLKKENAELAASVRMRDAREDVMTALTAAGSNSPALAFEAIKGSLQFDDAGKLINSKDLIEGLKTNYPEQFGTPKPLESIDAGKGGQPGEKLTKEKLEKMTPDEINKLDFEKEVAPLLMSV